MDEILFFGMVCSFCEAHEINVPNIDDMFITLDRSRRDTVTNLHHFHVEMFYNIIDTQLQELNDRFSEVNVSCSFVVHVCVQIIHLLLLTRIK